MPDVFQKCVYVYGGLLFDLFHHSIDNYVGAGTTHTCATMNHDRTAEFGIRARGLFNKSEHGQNVIGHAMIWPISEVILIDESLSVTALFK